jgi:hypothetical protein
MRRDSDYQELGIVDSIHDTEREPPYKHAPRIPWRRCAAHRMANCLFKRGFHGRLESDAGSSPGVRVVRDLVQQLGFGLRQETNRCHLAMARALVNTSSADSACTSPRS